MNTEISTLIQRFMLHTNDAILGLCLNNHSDGKGVNDKHDHTKENTYNVYQTLEKYLNTCQAQLENKLAKPIAQQVASIIAIHADETILTDKLYANGYLWPKLQKAYIGNQDGGNVFFHYVDDLIHAPQEETPKILFEVFQYCLDNGFKGRHYGNQQALNYYNKQLIDRIDNNEGKPKTHETLRARHAYA